LYKEFVRALPLLIASSGLAALALARRYPNLFGNMAGSLVVRRFIFIIYGSAPNDSVAAV
jgi:hypothetical protein